MNFKREDLMNPAPSKNSISIIMDNKKSLKKKEGAG